ncbi:MAG: DNA mismatch repair endonuclease MutL [Bacteroidales bacterium]|nr:DNA mismatch repair endonuclease MutL [Bacteroidales bacterium]
MSDIIHLLPDSVANQIAAGEVVQRPSSVIKELVENSIDAGATQVQVIVEDAGKSLVQVIDNGKGMSETDARLAFERHATSKISDAKDLFALRTMGFRGEALASIAAVAQVELRTRAADKDLGVSIVIEGSRVVDQQPVNCPVGANFAVKNLFFNIPARRKFLKSNQTELSNILTEFERIALAHPETSFSLHSGGVAMMNLPAGNFKQRILGVFGKRLEAKLIPVEVKTTLINLSGFVGVPSASRRKNAQQFFFVNGRYMRHPYFAKAVQTAYERLIPDGEQVPFFLNLEVAPEKIDVNIHPTKTEIKFEDETPIWQILLAAVREALGKHGVVPSLEFNTEGRPDIPVFTPGGNDVPAPQIEVNPDYNPFDTSHSYLSGKGGGAGGSSYTYNNKPAVDRHWQNAYAAAFPDKKETDFGDVPDFPADQDAPAAQMFQSLPSEEQGEMKKSETDYFQFRGQYIITPVKSGLMLIDQHRAHVRILYDRFMARFADKPSVTQRLLFPQRLTLPPSEAVAFEKMMQDLQSVGFEVSSLGGGDFSVLGTPAGTEGLDASELLQDILQETLDGKSDAADGIRHRIALTLARRAAMPVGEYLSGAEMSALVDQLFSTGTPNFTPDGQTVLVILAVENIEKLFGK